MLYSDADLMAMGAIASKCMELNDANINCDFESKFKISPVDFRKLSTEEQGAHLESYYGEAIGGRAVVAHLNLERDKGQSSLNLMQNLLRMF